MSTSPASNGTGRPGPEDPTAPGSQQADSDAVADLRAQLALAQDRRLRALADLENYRKRADRETQRRVADARQSLLLDWLDAVDSVERALRLKPEDPGLDAVLSQMDLILGREGVVRIEATGERFDPARHEAVAILDAGDGVADHTVLEVARSGFALKDGTILRPAQVLVARRQAGEG